MKLLDLGPDELLTTTRAVRKRLDFERPLELAALRECLDVAIQAPTGGNTQGWDFVIVLDAGKRAALADLYRKAWQRYAKAPGSVYDLWARETDAPRKAQLDRVCASADHLVENLHRVPAFVIPCTAGRIERMTGDRAAVGLASVYGSILPATWSFMLAARARGIGTVWTTCHLIYEAEAADILAIPYDRVSQVALIPTAWTLGTDFKPALRQPLEDKLHVDRW